MEVDLLLLALLEITRAVLVAREHLLISRAHKLLAGIPAPSRISLAGQWGYSPMSMREYPQTAGLNKYRKVG